MRLVVQGIVRPETILPSLPGQDLILPLFQKTSQLYQLMRMLAL